MPAKPGTGQHRSRRTFRGPSSACNPRQNRHRQEAKARILTGISRGPGLTLQQLQQHDRGTASPTDEEASEILTIGGFSTSTYNTLRSTCSNVSMKRFLTKWNPSSELHKEMLAVLGATTDTIRSSSGGQETETAYFAVLMTTLETVETNLQRSAVLSLLAMVIDRVPPAVLRKEFSAVSIVCINLLEAYIDSEQVASLRGLIKIVTATLKVQEQAVWNESSTLQVFSALLPFVTHPKPKVRKVAQQGIYNILQGSTIMLQQNAPLVHPAAASVAQFCIQNVQTASAVDVPISTLHLLGFLRAMLPMFGKAHVKGACEVVLNAMTVGQLAVRHAGMTAVRGLFLAKPVRSSLSPELNAQLLNALYSFIPTVKNTELVLLWLLTMQDGLVNLNRLSEDLCLAHLPEFFSTATRFWLTEKSDIHARTSSVITTLLQNCVHSMVEKLEPVTSEHSHSGVAPFLKLIGHLHETLQLQFYPAWAYTLPTWAVVFQVLGSKFHLQMREPLQLLAELRDTNRLSSTHLLDRAIGTAIRVMGPRVVLDAVPLKITGCNDDTEFPRSWLLPVMRDNIQGTHLAFFIDYFLPLADVLHRNAGGGEMALSKTYKILELQTWSLLPGFCTNPVDVVPSFSILARTLGQTLVSRQDLRLEVMSALRRLISTLSCREADLAEVSRFAKNFLPILFNIYTQEANGSQEEGIRLAVYDTIKSYVSIADGKICTDLFVKATQNLEMDEIPTFRRHSILDLTRALLQKLDMDNIQMLFHIARMNTESTDRTVQKKSYRLLEEICSAKTDAGRTFVVTHVAELQGLLLDTLRIASPASRAPRLRCMCLLIGSLNLDHRAFVLSALHEAVLCVSVNAAKVREAAFLVVLQVGRALARWSNTPEAGLQELIEQLVAGLTGSAYAISCTLLALSTVLLEFKGQYNDKLLDYIMEAVGILMRDSSREVIQAALHFVQMLFLILKPEALTAHLQKLITWLCNINVDCRKRFRVQLRSIFVKFVRRFSFKNIAGMVPESHRKLITNIRKLEAHKSRS